jgi:hypothetical protein
MHKSYVRLIPLCKLLYLIQGDIPELVDPYPSKIRNKLPFFTI